MKKCLHENFLTTLLVSYIALSLSFYYKSEVQKSLLGNFLTCLWKT